VRRAFALVALLILAGVKAAITAAEPDSVTTLGVRVRDGVVTLTGRVRDRTTLDHAERAAHSVAGVQRVDVAAVRVDPHAPRPKEQVGDLTLQARILAALTAEFGINHIGVHVHDGVVTLDGTARDEQQKVAAVATARGTSGIRNVVDRIRVERS
jgi:osmotically-inducible protein OsmY